MSDSKIKIEISKKVYDFINNLTDQIANQSNRGTQNPLYLVLDEKIEWCGYNDEWDDKERTSEIQEDYLCESCASKYENGFELPEDCDDCDYRAFAYLKKASTFLVNWYPTVFLTEEACKKFMEENKHHMTDEAVIYVHHLWRNRELRNIVWALFDIAGKEKPRFWDDFNW